MVDRTVRVTLTAQAVGYLQGIDQVQRKTREAASEMEKLAQKRQAFQTLGVGALAFGAAAAAGIGVAVAKYAEFDQAMSNANAILQESTENQKLLKDAALEAGGATVFTATESANAIEELGKAGVETADILGGGLAGSLDLAASAQLGVARAAEITGITLKQFKLDGTEAGRVADVLSAGANKAVGSVEDLANGLKFVGPVADGMNVSLEDAVATLTLFADRGVIGEQAGTSLRGMLSSLTSPSKAAKKELDALGVSLYDGQGRFKGLENVAGELNRALYGVSDAQRDASLGVIFGNQQLTTARILVDAGAEGWRDYRDSVDDAGLASRIAQDRMDNLAGDVEKLGGAFDTALIQTGSGANDVLRGMVQAATALVDWIGELPEPVINGGLAVAGLGAAVLVATGITFTAIPKWQAFKTSIDALGISAGTTALKAGLIGVAVAGAAAVLTVMATQAANARAKVEAYADTLEDGTFRITRATRELVKQNLSDVPDFWARLASTSRIESVYDSAEKLGLSLDTVTDAAAGSADALEELSPYLNRVASDTEFAESEAQRLGISYGDLTNAADNTARGIRGESESLEEAVRVAKQKQRADEDSVSSSKSAADAYLATNEEVQDLTDSLQKLIDTLNEVNGINQDAISANIDYQNTLRDVDEAIRNGAHGLDINTQAGADNMEMLLDLAESAWGAAEAQFNLDGNVQSFKGSLEASREALIQRAMDLGYLRAEAVDLADKILAIPTESEWKMIADTSAAKNTIDTFVRTYDGKTITMKLNADQVVVNGKVYNGLRSNYMGGLYSGGVQEFAAGGFPSGIYPYTPGGIHKFAEAGDEAYISFQPQYRERNIGIWQESGERLGVWRQAAPYGFGAAASQSVDRSVHAPITIRAADPAVAAEFTAQRLGSYMAVR